MLRTLLDTAISLSLLCSPLLAFAQEKADSSLNPQLGRVYGRVLNAQTGQAIVGANIVLRAVAREQRVGGSPQNPGRSGQSAVDGAFEFDQIPLGKYVAHVEAPGFGQWARRAAKYVNALPAGFGGPLEFYLSPGGSIAGFISDGSGRGLAGAIVSVLVEQSGDGGTVLRQVARERADQHGNFSVGNLPPGRFRFAAEAPPAPAPRGRSSSNSTGGEVAQPEAAPVLTFYPSSLSLDSAGSVALRGGQSFYGAIIEMRRAVARSITGKVSGGGLAAAGLTVSLYPESEMRALSLGREAVVSNGGVFTFQDVPPGRYLLEATGDQIFSRIRVEVGDRDLLGLDLPILPPAVISGQITCDDCAPDQHTTVTLIPSDPTARAQAHTVTVDGGKSFEISGLTRCRYLLHVAPPEGFLVESAISGGGPVVGSVLDLSSSIGALQLTLKRGGVDVQGDVSSAAGSVAWNASATVLLLAADGGKFRFADAPLGRFVFRGLPPGKYVAFAVSDFDRDLWTQNEFVSAIRPSGLVIEASDKNPGTPLHLPLLTDEVLFQVAERSGAIY